MVPRCRCCCSVAPQDGVHQSCGGSWAAVWRLRRSSTRAARTQVLLAAAGCWLLLPLPATGLPSLAYRHLAVCFASPGVEVAWRARRRAALREAAEEGGGCTAYHRPPSTSEVALTEEQGRCQEKQREVLAAVEGGRLVLPELAPLCRGGARAPRLERVGVRLPPGLLRMVDDPALTVPIQDRTHGTTFFFVCECDHHASSQRSQQPRMMLGGVSR
jgi:hypothetical protein